MRKTKWLETQTRDSIGGSTYTSRFVLLDSVLRGEFLGDVPEIGGESDLGSPGCLLQDALLILECKPNWTHAHSRTIAPTVVGARVFRMEPPIEKSAVSSIRVAPADLADRFKIRATRQDRLCNSNREYCVIGEVTERAKQLEILRLDRP